MQEIAQIQEQTYKIMRESSEVGEYSYVELHENKSFIKWMER